MSAATLVEPIVWIENQYKGFRSADATCYVGQTPNGFYRVWVGDVLRREIFPNAAEAKSFAETLDRPAPVVAEMLLRVVGADAEKLSRILAPHGIMAEVVAP
jgi:hypothetical protein